MSQLPRGLRIHLAAGILVPPSIVLAIISLFYIDHWLLVVYIVLVVYLVSKCDSEAARGNLNSLSDPNIHRVRFRARSIIVLYYRFVIVSYRTKSGKEKTQKTKYQKREAYSQKLERIRKNTQKKGRNLLTNGMIKAGHRHGVISSYMCSCMHLMCPSRDRESERESAGVITRATSV
jgi:hypothetical protein